MSVGVWWRFMAVAAKLESGVTFTARGLTKVYRGAEVPVHALRGVDLEIGDGEIVVLLGPSGSGKSTLLHILGGLDTPSEGQAVLPRLGVDGA